MKNCFLFLVLFAHFSSHAQDLDDTVYEFPVPVFTNSNLSLLILESAWKQAPIFGDEWAVIDTEGQIVGASPIFEGHNGMPIWGDAPNTSVKDGLSINERFSILHWSREEDVYDIYSQFSIHKGSDFYIKDGFTIVSSLGPAEVYKRPSDVYYHLKSVLSETTNIFSFYINQSGTYSLRVLHENKVIFEQVNLVIERGFYAYDYPNDLSSGGYEIILYIDNNQFIKKDFFVSKL